MNIIEYINKFGSFSFQERSFNDIDMAIFATLSYAKFESIIPDITQNKKGTLISDFSDQDIVELSKINTFDKLITDLMHAVRGSNRFKDVLVENSMSVSDTEALEQFSAITFVVPYVGLVVGFRGTDGSSIGWKENFSVLYQGATLSQIDAIEYLNQVNAIHKNESYILAGHSKGGNLSLYSLFFGPEEIRNKITSIYSYDGYGFKHKDFKNLSDYKELLERIHQIAPEGSIIGELFYTPDKYKVIKANGKGVNEHHPLNWCISDDGEFEEVKERCFKSRFFHRMIKKWSQSSSNYNYKVFSDIIIEAFNNENGEFEIAKKGNNPVRRVLRVASKKTLKEKFSFFVLTMKLGFSAIGCFFYYLFNK